MKPQNITQKILSYHSNRTEVVSGEFIEVNVSFAFANDITAPIAIEQFLKTGKRVFNPESIALILDHFTPNKDTQTANQCRLIRGFAKEHGIKHFYEGGFVGIEHVLLPEQGLVLPGDIVIGADSHTCTHGALGCYASGMGSTDLAYIFATGKTWLKVPKFVKVIFYGKLNEYVTGKDLILYLISKIGVDGAIGKSLEFSGEIIRNLPMHDRFTICNMVIECGAENGIIQPDEVTISYINGRAKREYKIFKSDDDSKYDEIIEVDCSEIQPLIAFPHSPANVRGVNEIDEKIYIDQVFIGSCTNGWYEDLERAARILKGKKVNKNVRLIITPATPQIYMKALKNGLIEVFMESGAIITPPSCGPCLGGHLGVLAKGERCLSTTNRNFQGRMGDLESEIYLSNPYVAASSAVAGYITLV